MASILTIPVSSFYNSYSQAKSQNPLNNMIITKSCPPTKPLSKEELWNHFLKCDADGDQLLTKAELKDAFRKLGAMIPGFRTWEGLRCADGNKDGCVSRDELTNLIQFVHNLQYTSISDK
ncbi:putative Calcium-binding EF-hand family protein [Hibiscus syriacus]|uniref:Calcium-binding EF-hand family protein n=1 Tax=Hibiscus syriacus TaxID=106335 RepID=A0A6A2Y102_HIBSY|nr:putative Calcium-binding EF-hand family protein [Hibiscus syriacus]